MSTDSKKINQPFFLSTYATEIHNLPKNKQTKSKNEDSLSYSSRKLMSIYIVWLPVLGYKFP